jgi:hypothetical protein
MQKAGLANSMFPGVGMAKSKLDEKIKAQDKVSIKDFNIGIDALRVMIGNLEESTRN